MAVVYDEAFQGYTLAESIPQRGDWEIDLGAAGRLFRAMLPALFSTVKEREALAPEPEDSTAELLLRPPAPRHAVLHSLSNALKLL